MAPFSTIDSDLALVIRDIESSDNPHAIRFEATLYSSSNVGAIWSTIAAKNKCTLGTAKMIAYTSYGWYQIMGFNLYELGLDSDIADYMTDTALQTQLYGEFLDKKKINVRLAAMLVNQNLLDLFAVTYNGSLKYGAAIRATAARLNLGGAST